MDQPQQDGRHRRRLRPRLPSVRRHNVLYMRMLPPTQDPEATRESQNALTSRLDHPAAQPGSRRRRRRRPTDDRHSSGRRRTRRVSRRRRRLLLLLGSALERSVQRARARTSAVLGWAHATTATVIYSSAEICMTRVNLSFCFFQVYPLSGQIFQNSGFHRLH